MTRLLTAAAALLLAIAPVAARADLWSSTAPGGGGCPLTGCTFTGAVNTTNVAGYQQNGVTILDQQNVVQGSLLIGAGAGSAQPAGGIFSTFIGYNAGHAFTGATGEATCIGTIACQFLTTGNFDTALGENAMGREITASSSTAIGNDAQRSYVSSGAGSNTTVGKSAMITGGGNFNNTLGVQALAGNSSVVTLGGTATNGDTVTLTFTGSFPGSPQSQAITITAAETTTQMATAMAAAINGNSAIFNNAFVATPVLSQANQLTFLWPGTATTGFSIVITSNVTGSATETVTVSSTGATGNDNIAIGYQALNGAYTLSTGFANIAIGSSALANVSTGNGNVALGIGSGGAISTGLQNVLAGNASGAALTTSQGTVAVGPFALTTMTTATGTAVGNNAGNHATGVGGTFVGNNAGLNVAAGTNNTALGSAALQAAASSSAAFSVALGSGAMQVATSAQGVTAVGFSAGNKITTGGPNLILGNGVASTTLTTGSSNILIGTSSTVDTLASNTSGEINIGGLLFWNAVNLGAPAVSACGTSPTIDSHANNRSGTVTIGTATPASCTVTFAGAGYTTWNHCRVTPGATFAAFAYSQTLTVLTITGTALSGKVDYDCDGV